LSSTGDFTNRHALALVDRKLILFLIVALVDEQQCLTTAYLALLATWSTVEGHWAYGKTLPAIQKSCAKHLGKGAEKLPSWRKIRDTVHAALPPAEAAAVLAVAAGLFCQAKNISRPDGYDGEIRRPWWTGPEVEHVTVDMIREAFAAEETHERPGAAPQAGPGPAVDAATTGLHGADENAALRLLLDAVIRAYRMRDRDCHAAENAAQHQWSDSKALTERAREATTELDQLRRDSNELRQRLEQREQEVLRLLRLLHPQASDDTLRGLINPTVERGTPVASVMPGLGERGGRHDAAATSRGDYDHSASVGSCQVC